MMDRPPANESRVYPLRCNRQWIKQMHKFVRGVVTYCLTRDKYFLRREHLLRGCDVGQNFFGDRALAQYSNPIGIDADDCRFEADRRRTGVQDQRNSSV